MSWHDLRVTHNDLTWIVYIIETPNRNIRAWHDSIKLQTLPRINIKVQYIRNTSEYILKLHIHQHSLLTRKVFSRHNLSAQVFLSVSSGSSSPRHLQVIFIFKSSSSSSHLHQVWVIESSSKMDHHWIINKDGSSLDHHQSWIITGASSNMDHDWIMTGSSSKLDHH